MPLHATSVAIDGRVILLTGASGSGKSDLALRLIDRGATLVSDDYTLCIAVGEKLLAAPPPAIVGKMEVRHLGIIPMPHLHNLPVALILRLDDKPLRMPETASLTVINGVMIPLLALDAREPSAPIKAELALRHFGLSFGAPSA